MRATYGDLYTVDNVIISGTHTHGTPGGFMMDLLYDMTTFGFVSETHAAIIEGIYRVSKVINELYEYEQLY